MTTWQGDIHHTPESAHKIVSDQFPEFKNLNYHYLTSGWDNYILEYENSTIFRLPRREVAFKLMQTECQALPYLKGKLPLPIPHLEYIGKPTKEFPSMFHGYKSLDGNSITNWLEFESKPKIANKLADFLKSLHNLTIPTELQSQLPPDLFNRSDAQITYDKANERINEYKNTYPDFPMLKIEEQMNQLLQKVHPLTKRKNCLCHGDLHPLNLLSKDGMSISGIIDWGDIHWGQPIIDLAIAYTMFNPDDRKIFFTQYGEVSEQENALAQLRALNYAIILFISGHDLNNENFILIGWDIAKKNLILK